MSFVPTVDLRLVAPSVNVGVDSAQRPVLTVVLPEQPKEAWTYTVHFIGGQPHFLHLAFDASDPARHPVARQAQTFSIPWLRLVGIWRLVFNLHVDGTQREEPGNLWDVLRSAEKLALGPRPRMRRGRSAEDYRREMTEWTEPVAAAMLAAHTAGLPVQKYVAQRFGFSVDRAKQVIETAREFHTYLPKQSRPDDIKTSAPTRKPRRSGRTERD